MRGSGRSNGGKPVVFLTALVLVGISLGPMAVAEEPAPWCPNGATEGCWRAPIDGQEPAVNLAIMPDGSAMYYSGIEADESQEDPDALHFMWNVRPIEGKSRVLHIDGYNDDGTVSYTVSTPAPADGGAGDLFCSGHSVRPDGTLLAVGATQWRTLDDDGADATFAPLKGGNGARLFSTDGTWAVTADMAVDRWYPSLITLDDGSQLVASGIQSLVQAQTHNNLLERYTGDAWERIEPTLRFADGVEAGNVGSHQGLEVNGEDYAPDETQIGLMNLPMYPRLFVVPSGPLEGNVFYPTVGALWGPFGERPEEALFSMQQSLDTDTGVWTVHGPSMFGARQHGAVVPLVLDPSDGYRARLLSFGGTLQRSVAAVPLAEVIDLGGSEPVNTQAASMNFGRWHLNGILLPTGEVLAVGGSDYDNVVMHGSDNNGIMPAEIYDPVANEWTTLAAMEVERGYHSTAALLPDGRVLAGGHVPLPHFHKAQREVLMNEQIVERRLEIFEPPYLHLDDTRPRIVDLSTTSAAFGATVDVTVADLEGGAASVILMRPGATTHAFDADQRAVRAEVLAASTDTDGNIVLTVRMPPTGAVAPPGAYMVFVNEDVDGEPFPSEAAFLDIGVV